MVDVEDSMVLEALNKACGLATGSGGILTFSWWKKRGQATFLGRRKRKGMEKV